MVLSLAVLGAATLLCYAGKLDASAVVALFGAAVALLGSNAKDLGTGIVNGGPKPNYDKLAQSDPAELGRVLESQRAQKEG